MWRDCWIHMFSTRMNLTEYIILVIFHSMVSILYFVLLVLLFMNIWQILIKQGKWRTIPLLFFYIFAFLAIIIRCALDILFNDFNCRFEVQYALYRL